MGNNKLYFILHSFFSIFQVFYTKHTLLLCGGEGGVSIKKKKKQKEVKNANASHDCPARF